MAKQRKRVKKQRIDRLPMCFQQPRSPPRKRRTDFSLFFCSSSASSLTNSFHQDDRMDIGNIVSTCSRIQCKESKDGGRGFLSNVVEVPIAEVESVAQKTLSDPSNKRNFDEQQCDTAETLDFTPIKSQITEINDVSITPGSIVWAKTACQMWWPAEIMDETSTSANSRNQGIDGHVLVQYYGNHRSAWVDPTRDLSLLEECFEERSSNPMEDFQDALQEALGRKERINSCGQLFGSPNGCSNSNRLDQSSDKWNSSSSSRTEDDFLGKGRGKRKRKPKVHFDVSSLLHMSGVWSAHGELLLCFPYLYVRRHCFVGGYFPSEISEESSSVQDNAVSWPRSSYWFSLLTPIKIAGKLCSIFLFLLFHFPSLQQTISCLCL
ncbi:uncharacterized protein LOC131168156 isoform X2 [Malania oleifera]|uniref:uncharacterized protein LOC131168156 isoform X2 n=1 Tax=Malania oleifera TaxID=397392 RepID=UPI0025ADE5B9|nr:uncharacterized protein LOC131168156 isoform X2 [Malania oleifera]